MYQMTVIVLISSISNVFVQEKLLLQSSSADVDHNKRLVGIENKKKFCLKKRCDSISTNTVVKLKLQKIHFHKFKIHKPYLNYLCPIILLLSTFEVASVKNIFK